MPDEINSAFSQALGRDRDALREYVSSYKRATPADNANLIERDPGLTLLQRKLAAAAEPLGIDWQADVQKELGAGYAKSLARQGKLARG